MKKFDRKKRGRNVRDLYAFEMYTVQFIRTINIHINFNISVLVVFNNCPYLI